MYVGEAVVSVDANTSYVSKHVDSLIHDDDQCGSYTCAGYLWSACRSLKSKLALIKQKSKVRTHAVDKAQSTASPFWLKAYLGLYGLSPKMVEFQNHSEESEEALMPRAVHVSMTE